MTTDVHTNDNSSLPTCNTKIDAPVETVLPTITNSILHSAAPYSNTNQTKDTATVTSALTLDTVANRMDAYEGSIASVQTEVAEIHNSINHTKVMLQQLCSQLNTQQSAAKSNGPSGKKS